MTEITKKTAGALNTAEVIQVVAQLNVNLPYRLKCVHFYEKMLELLTLKQVSPDDDFSRPYFTNEYGSILLGTASFGLLENDILKASPILKKEQKLVVLLDQQRFSFKDGICNKLDKTFSIIIYTP